MGGECSSEIRGSEAGSYVRLIDFVSLNSRLESNTEEDNMCSGWITRNPIHRVYHPHPHLSPNPCGHLIQVFDKILSILFEYSLT